MAVIDREGRFTAQMLETSLFKAEGTEAVAFNFHAALMHEAVSNEWAALDPMPDVRGAVWLVKKDGTINENAVKQLKEALGWDGDWNKLDGADHKWPDFQVDVQADTYNGKTTFKGTWLHHFEADPSQRGGKAMEPGEKKSLAAKYQAQTRAICGVKQSGAPGPKGKPPAPAKKAETATVPPSDETPPF